MSTNVWVCKPDGTIQCEDIEEISLETARAELETLIGAQNILNGEKKATIVPQQCGLPTGVMNSFEITAEGYDLLGGFLGPNDWKKCSDDGNF